MPRRPVGRRSAATRRRCVGGFDLAGSDALLHGAGRRFHSRYFSVGRQVGRAVYVSGDYSTSLSVLHFSRSDGIEIDMRPRTRRVSANTVWNVGRSISVLASVDRTIDDQARELRLLTGITDRLR
jgi:hypothetical protein